MARYVRDFLADFHGYYKLEYFHYTFFFFLFLYGHFALIRLPLCSPLHPRWIPFPPYRYSVADRRNDPLMENATAEEEKLLSLLLGHQTIPITSSSSLSLSLFFLLPHCFLSLFSLSLYLFFHLCRILSIPPFFGENPLSALVAGRRLYYRIPSRFIKSRLSSAFT